MAQPTYALPHAALIINPHGADPLSESKHPPASKLSRVQSMSCAVSQTYRLTTHDMLCWHSIQYQHNLFCVQIRIPTQNLQATFSEVKGRHVWGTDVYTDDSDIVCAVMHCGYYNASLKKPVAMVSEMRVVIQLLPPQIEYPVFVRNGIRSRAWWAGGTSCSYKVHPSSSSHDVATHTYCLCTLCCPSLPMEPALKLVGLAALAAPTRCFLPHVCMPTSLRLLIYASRH